ncbi:hypothetical protein NDI54_20510 [Haloarcula sp. S1AR25-5A]|uniref:Uncharacterized protein n=1 Tax=Haloarcula terrestris TaxID=2950533 RepID=A0AAE4JKW7_9EURY|nr:hypothetical protein [Haloarcula terrestris]MDS0223729.1 hypothetical protein [Haloarcula terrestris]
MFVEYGYAVTVRDRRLAVPVAAVIRFLVWRGWPTLGRAYAWALEGDVYERQCGEV